MRRPHLFRIKYVQTEKLHQSLFGDLNKFLLERENMVMQNLLQKHVPRPVCCVCQSWFNIKGEYYHVFS
mgnify:CR=1 FL=1